MKTLLEQRHPDISFRVAGYCKTYRHLTETGDVIEALERKSFDEDFTDVTERERERVRLERTIREQEQEIHRIERDKTITLYIADDTAKWTDDKGNTYEVIHDEDVTYLYRPGHPTLYNIVDDSQVFTLVVKEDR